MRTGPGVQGLGGVDADCAVLVQELAARRGCSPLLKGLAGVIALCAVPPYYGRQIIIAHALLSLRSHTASGRHEASGWSAQRGAFSAFLPRSCSVGFVHAMDAGSPGAHLIRCTTCPSVCLTSLRALKLCDSVIAAVGGCMSPGEMQESSYG